MYTYNTHFLNKSSNPCYRTTNRTVAYHLFVIGAAPGPWNTTASTKDLRAALGQEHPPPSFKPARASYSHYYHDHYR